MNLAELLFLAVGLSMDAFAVSICKGLSVAKVTARNSLTCGVWFGGFQALMPLAGFFLGTLFAEAIRSFDHWVAFGLLSLIGLNMIREACSDSEELGCSADFSCRTMLLMAIATSIDALAVGVSLAMAENVNIWTAVTLIGGVTFGISVLGVRVGNVFGCRYEKKAELAGGVILMLLGLKILLTDLGVFA